MMGAYSNTLKKSIFSHLKVERNSFRGQREPEGGIHSISLREISNPAVYKREKSN